MESTKKIEMRQKPIGSLTGLKVIAMLLLFWHHSTMPKLSIDLGARTCEFLFVVSGFLVGYNYFYIECPATWRESFRYAYSKFLKFWPLHFLTMLLVLVVKVRPLFTVPNLIRTILNILLLQAWSPCQETYFAYNGASWFLSALLFCYFMAPILIHFSKRIKGSITLFLGVFFIRYGIEYIELVYPGQFLNFQIHTNPIVRCLEFFMGMLMVPIFIYLKEHIEKNRKLLFSVLEVSMFFSVAYLIYFYNLYWYRAMYVGIFCLTIMLFAFDNGIISKFLNLKIFKLFSQIQFEFYILHQAMIICLENFFNKYMLDWKLKNICMFISIMTAATLYKIFLSRKCFDSLKKINNIILCNFVNNDTESKLIKSR